MNIYDIKINGAGPCLTMPAKNPRFGWKIQSDKTSVLQKSYKMVVKEAGKTVYESKDIPCGISSDVVFDGLELKYETNYDFELFVELNNGEKDSIKFAGKTELGPDGFSGAVWIKPKTKIVGWAPYLRTKFELKDKAIKEATLYGVGLGIGEFYINDKRTDDYYLESVTTNYDKIVYYRGIDVTKLVSGGKNALTCMLGQGFYSQNRVWGPGDMVYGDECLLVKLVVVYENGDKDIILSNTKDWKTKLSPISTNNVYAGEIYDARLETQGFASAEGSDDGWGDVVVDETPKGILTPCLMPPVREIRELPCIKTWNESGKSDGAFLFDLGENFAGTYEVRIPAGSPRGAVYVFRTAESLSPSGNLDHRSTGGFATQCIQQDIYMARGGNEVEIYKPRFTYHGFRYVEITGIHDYSQGYGTEPKPEMIKGIQLSTDFTENSSFESSYKNLDTLNKMMRNTYRSNYHGYPEDCPAREKCGWLGDAEIVCNYGLLTYDSQAAYEKYLEDIRTSYEVFGVWQMVAPGKRACLEASPLWGCAQIIIPYYLWKYKGDKLAITKNIELMRLWIEHELNRSNDYIVTAGLGDWCPHGGNDHPQRMPIEQSSTMMFYEVCDKMVEISKAFGYGDEEKYEKLAADIKDSILRHYYDLDKNTYGFWASNGVALMLNLYPEGKRNELVKSTIKLIEDDNFIAHTGIYGNKYLVPALFEEGYGDYALKYLFNEDPNQKSFGTMIKDHGTSVWEVFDRDWFDGNRNYDIPSYNHPMHGGFLYTYYTEIAGITPIIPGFKKMEIAPKLCDSIGDISVKLDTPYGLVCVAYKTDEHGNKKYNIVVPANTTALIKLTGKETIEVGSGEYVF